MRQELKAILSKNFKDIREVKPHISDSSEGFRWACSGGIEWHGEQLHMTVWVHKDNGTRIFNIDKLGPFEVNAIKGEGKMERKYYEVVIQSKSSGFGKYEVKSEEGELWDSAEELLSEISQNIGEFYELGVDELPEPLEDIRGRIHNKPDRVFGYIIDDQAYYFGIAIE